MSIDAEIEKVKNKYRKNSKIQAPAFDNETIRLGTHFWTHIKYRRNERLRKSEDIFKRLRAVDKMMEIIKTTLYYQDFYRGKDKNTIMYFWTFIAVIDGARYGVIIRRKGKNGNKHFYSIIPDYQGCIPREKKLTIRFG